MASFTAQLKHGWNAFRNKEPTDSYYTNTYVDYGSGSSSRPDRTQLRYVTERSITSAIFTRIAIDVSEMVFQHVQLDDKGRYESSVDDGLNYCLTTEANVDQTSKMFLRDIVLSMFDEGCIAIIPVDTDRNPDMGSFDVDTMRTAKIIQWYPQHVQVQVYNDQNGKMELITMSKRDIAIIENPFYTIMNEPNSTSKRLIRKLNLLDSIDEQSGSGKLDLIIQLPYVVKTEAREQQAEKRRKAIEMQLSGSKYGIAYIDGTEHVTQLNRAVENNLMGQVTYLTDMLYDQLSITKTIMNGTADEETMTNYMIQTVNPVVAAIVDEFMRKFLTQTARTQHEAIMAFRDVFKYIPVSKMGDVADKFTRNEIMSSNEIRTSMGLKPSADPAADQLRNKNLNSKTNPMDPSQASNAEDTPNMDNVKNMVNSMLQKQSKKQNQ